MEMLKEENDKYSRMMFLSPAPKRHNHGRDPESYMFAIYKSVVEPGRIDLGIPTAEDEDEGPRAFSC